MGLFVNIEAIEVLDLVKQKFNLDIFDWEPPIFFLLFSEVFHDFFFLLEIFATYLTLLCFKCILYMDDHIDQVGMSTLWNDFQDQI